MAEHKEQAQDIYSYITQEESGYLLPITVIEGYEWNMKQHIKLSTLYKHSELESGKLTGTADEKPVKNIVRPILNVQYRSEGFDVKDIDLFVDSADEYYKSFLVRKYHDKWARENSMDTFIDDMVESYVDFGGALIKDAGDFPEVVQLQSLAFCDQTDILSGPLAIKHFFSPDQLLDMESRGWGNTDNGATATLDEVIVFSEASKRRDKNAGKNKTPGKYVEVYEVHGTLPESFLKKDGDSTKYVSQLQIVTFYSDDKGNKKGLTLFKGKEKESSFKFIARDKVFGRALGFGGVEELFEAQIWVNNDQIRIKDMLDAASKIVFQTTDDAYATRNNLADMDNMEITVLKQDTTLSQVNTTPVNITVFNNSVLEWEQHAMQMGSANEAVLGESPKSGTPFALQQLVTNENKSLHIYRQGKLATFTDEIYRDWVIPRYLIKDITKGQEFIATLSLDELETVADNLMTVRGNELIKEKILKGERFEVGEIEAFKQLTKERFVKGDGKKFIKILKDELKKSPINVHTNIVGKQKYQAQMTEKVVNVFRQIIATPEVLQNPAMAKIFNDILESSGMSPINFAALTTPRQPDEQPQPTQRGAKTTQPLKELNEVTA